MKFTRKYPELLDRLIYPADAFGLATYQVALTAKLDSLQSGK